MCRLFGLIADAPVSPENPLLLGTRPFIDLSHKHNDGWGIGYRDDGVGGGAPHIVRSPRPAYRDKHFAELVKQLVAPIFIVHLRDAKYGEVALRNTHPFYKDGWMFAHNGSIHEYRDLDALFDGVRFEGETDSERYFHLVLRHIGLKGDVRKGMISAIQWLELNQFHGAKNFLMSDGRRLYAYRDGRDLHYTVREMPAVPSAYSKDTAAPDPVALATPVRSVIVASEPLTDEDWREVPEDHLVTVDENLYITIEPVMESIIACC